MKSIYFTILFVVQVLVGFSQSELPYLHSSVNAPEWAIEMYSENPDVEAVINGYQNYYAHHDFAKNQHTQYYKRWLRNQIRGLYDPMLSLDDKRGLAKGETAYLEKWKAHQSRRQSNDANWTSIGPFDWDHTAAGRSNSPGAAHIYIVRQCLSNPDVLYAGTATAGIWKSIDHGLTWQAITNALMTSEVFALDIHPSDENIVLANIGGEVWKTLDGGATWNKIGGPAFYAAEHFIKEIRFDPSNPEKVYVGTNVGLYRSEYGGDSLMLVFLKETQEIEFHPLSSDTIYAVRRNGFKTEFYKSIDGGLTFEQKTEGWPNPTIGENLRTEISVSPGDPNKVFALAAGFVNGGSGLYGVYVSNDAGETWTFNCCGPSPGGNASASNKNILGDNQFGTSNGGQYYYDLALEVSPTNTDSIYVGGINLWVSGDGGQDFVCPSNWDQPGASDYVHADIHDIHFNYVSNEIWISCDGGIFYSNNNGATYQRKMFGILGTDFNGFDTGFWDGDVMIGGTFHNSTHIKDNDVYTNGWLCTDNTGDGYRGFVNFGHERIVFSDINMKTLPGNRTASIPTQNYLHKPNIGNIGQKSKLAFDPRSYNAWYSGEGKELWKTVDHGETFSLVHTFNNDIADIEISWANHNFIYITEYTGQFSNKKIYKSVDGGDNWIDITIPQSLLGGSFYVPYDIALSAIDPNKLWVARLVPVGTINLNGKAVFESSDGGLTWQNITFASLDGEQLTGIIHQKGTEGTLYVGTRRSVYFKTASMSEWALFGQGLPANTYSTQMVPYYKEGKLRNATNRSVWECDFAEPSDLLAMPAADKLEVNCLKDTIQFLDHSILRGTGASWLWHFPNGTPSSSTLRNPKVVFNSFGGQTVQLTVSDSFGSNTRTFHDFVVVFNGCGADTVAGYSLALTGDPQYVQLPDYDMTMSTFSVTAWVRLDGFQNNFAAILMNDGTSAGFNLKGNNVLGYHWPGGDLNWNSGLTVPSNEWAHVAMVVDPESVTLYVNGVSSTHLVNTNPALFSTLKIGRFKDISSRSLEGQIDEVALWSKALTKDEIRLQRHLTKYVENDPDLLSYYQFNEPSGLIIDKVGGLDGTLNGGAQKVISKAPVGGGVSKKLSVTSGGPKDFGATNVIIGFPTSGLFPQGEVVVTRLNVLPVELPAGKVALTNGYWVINNYGTPFISDFKDIKLKKSGFFSDAMVSAPNLATLYSRDVSSDNPNWTLRINSNISLQNSLDGLIFYTNATGMNDLEQWVAVRDSFPFTESQITMKAPELNSYTRRGGSSALPGFVSKDRGIILPVLDDAEILAIPSPTAGAIVFGSERNTIAYFDGEYWQDVSTIPEKVINAGNAPYQTGFMIGPDTINIKPHAILDMSSSKGYMLPPRLINSEMLDLDFPVTGMLAFQQQNGRLVYFNGARWIPFNQSTSAEIVNGGQPVESIQGIAIGTNVKDVNAVLDIVSNNQAFQIPSMATENISSPSTGLFIFDPFRNAFLVYDGLKWKKLL